MFRVAAEEQQERLEFREVKDSAGRLVCRIAPCGILEIKQKNRDRVLVNLWEYLEQRDRR